MPLGYPIRSHAPFLIRFLLGYRLYNYIVNIMNNYHHEILVLSSHKGTLMRPSRVLTTSTPAAVANIAGGQLICLRHRPRHRLKCVRAAPCGVVALTLALDRHPNLPSPMSLSLTGTGTSDGAGAGTRAGAGTGTGTGTGPGAGTGPLLHRRWLWIWHWRWLWLWHWHWPSRPAPAAAWQLQR